MTHNIPPIVDPDCRILILGSFPSVKSREAAFYYAHPQNRFWRVIATLCGVPVPATVEEKKSMLLQNGIALWDVCGSCDVTGSADTSIENVIPNDIAALLRGTKIRRIYANGGTAYKLYKKYVEKETGIAATPLPSTSPANAALSLEKLVDRWHRIALSEHPAAFLPICDNLSVLRVPLECSYTSVYLVESGDAAVLVDCASYPEDVRDYILPALKKKGVTPSSLLLTHRHFDHAGGMDALCAAFPDLKVFAVRNGKDSLLPIQDGDGFADVLRAVTLPGHDTDCCAFYHEPSDTLLCGDALQQHGIGRFGVGLYAKSQYCASLDKVMDLAPMRLVMSHPFSPFGWLAEGKDVARVLCDCKAAYDEHAK